MQKNSLNSWQKIYVNRSLNMASIKSIGFDMDHTLVVYDRTAFETLAFKETLAKFIEAGYPDELTQLSFDPNFVIRGLLVDTERGNLLKVDGHKYVKTAFHGRMRLPKSERHLFYNSESFVVSRFLSVDSFFALSEVQLYFEIIDYMRCHPNKISKSFREVYLDLRRFIDLSHADGSIKARVLANPEKYISRDKSRWRCLTRFLESGKNLFLLTNSKWDYTDAIMSFVIGEGLDEISNWRDFFHHIIVGAGKPSFFTGCAPFYEVIENTEYLKPHQGPLESNRIYQGGNGSLFQKVTGLKGDEILYCGDHVFGDIIQSKEEYNWRTLLVVEELTSQLKESSSHRDDWQAASDFLREREEKDEEVQKFRSRMQANQKQLDQAQLQSDPVRIAKLSKKTEELAAKFLVYEQEVLAIDNKLDALLRERESRIHPIWGDPFRVGFEKSRFAKQIEEYACLYTSDVGNLRFYSPFKRFHSIRENMPHDQ